MTFFSTTNKILMRRSRTIGGGFLLFGPFLLVMIPFPAVILVIGLIIRGPLLVALAGYALRIAASQRTQFSQLFQGFYEPLFAAVGAATDCSG